MKKISYNTTKIKHKMSILPHYFFLNKNYFNKKFYTVAYKKIKTRIINFENGADE